MLKILEYHLQAARKSYYANKWILGDRVATVAARLGYFDKVVAPVACFAAGRRDIYQDELDQLDVAFRKLVRHIVGPPGGLDWGKPWRTILHAWHERMYYHLQKNGVRTWSEVCLRKYWSLASYNGRTN